MYMYRCIYIFVYIYTYMQIYEEAFRSWHVSVRCHINHYVLQTRFPTLSQKTTNLEQILHYRKKFFLEQIFFLNKFFSIVKNSNSSVYKQQILNKFFSIVCNILAWASENSVSFATSETSAL